MGRREWVVSVTKRGTIDKDACLITHRSKARVQVQVNIKDALLWSVIHAVRMGPEVRGFFCETVGAATNDIRMHDDNP